MRPSAPVATIIAPVALSISARTRMTARHRRWSDRQMPMKLRRTRPCRISSLNTICAVLLATAKADALRAHDDRGVDADDLAMRGDKRSARIAGIECGIGLDHVLDQSAACDRSERPSAEITPAVTVDSKPSGLPIATTSCPRRSASGSPSDARPEDADGSRRAATPDPCRGPRPAGARFHRDAAFGIGEPQFAGTLDYVAVGQHEAIRRDDDAGADTAGGAAILVLAARLDAHDSGPTRSATPITALE